MGCDGRDCPLCKKHLSLEALVASPDVEAIGMTLFHDDPTVSLFYFNHLPPGCKTTLALPVDAFADLVAEAIPEHHNAGAPDCEGHCKDIDAHEACSAHCHNAPYRRFMRDVLMRERKRG